MARNTKSKNLKAYIIASVAALIIATLVFFGIKLAYDRGVADGRADYESETSELLSSLGTAISEKSDFVKNSSSTLTDVPTEINEEGINTYIKNLTTLRDSTNTESVKSALNNYIAKWQEFKDTYASENNDAITEAFNELKTTTETLSTEIRQLYDAKITEALKKLQGE